MSEKECMKQAEKAYQILEEKDLETAELYCKFCEDRAKNGKLGALIDDGSTIYRVCRCCGYQWNKRYFSWLKQIHEERVT